MGIYEKCVEIQSKTYLLEENQETSESNLSLNNSAPLLANVPDNIQQDGWWRLYSDEFYYISDLHIVQHLLNEYKESVSDEIVNEFVLKIIEELFDGELKNDICNFKSPYVLFCGDISCNFIVAKFFYERFIEKWIEIEKESYEKTSKSISRFERKLEENKKILDLWQAKSRYKNLKNYELLNNKRVPQSIKNTIKKINELESKIKNKESGLAYNWREKVLKTPGPRCLYAVLGNHEFWDFKSYEECVTEYSKLFSNLGIHFLENNGVDINKNVWNGFVLIGGMGLAAKNNNFNAKQNIYMDAIDEEKEREIAKKWLKVFDYSLEHAKERKQALIVLTHMPVSDWIDNIDKVSNCIFFNGHTHRNVYYYDEYNNCVIADNQVGYKKKRLRFKKVRLYFNRNPYASDGDGYRITSISEYTEFYCYMQAGTIGTGTIEEQIKTCGGDLYVIKQQGYYGFFFVNKNGTYICNGGQIRKIDKCADIKKYNDLFLLMVKEYLKAFSPFRQMQETASSFIKSIGGSGTIHGTIVDIDFCNHIMFNPTDGKVTYYYAPWFGVAKSYPNIQSLLHAQCPDMEKRMLERGSDLSVSLVITDNSKMQKIDIKNSPYAISRRFNAIQRLFDKKILRDWNMDIINKVLEHEKMIEN